MVIVYEWNQTVLASKRQKKLMSHMKPKVDLGFWLFDLDDLFYFIFYFFLELFFSLFFGLK